MGRLMRQGQVDLTAEEQAARDAEYAKRLQHAILGGNILHEIGDERGRQDRKWGEQNHPNGTGGPGRDALARHFRDRCNNATKEGRLTWQHILAEEVYEAFAESDPVRLRAELIQVAAVAAAWIEAIDRRAERIYRDPFDDGEEYSYTSAHEGCCDRG